MPALKAFLRGEQYYRRTAWDSALAQYELAFSADTTFALAFRRFGLTRYWQWGGLDSLVTATASGRAHSITVCRRAIRCSSSRTLWRPP